jgi:hypothetical protein
MTVAVVLENYEKKEHYQLIASTISAQQDQENNQQYLHKLLINQTSKPLAERDVP